MNVRSVLFAAALALGFAVAPAPSLAAPKSDPKAEAKQKEKLAEVALAGAKALVEAKVRAEALRTLDEALALGATKAATDPLRTQATAIPEGVADAAGKDAWAKVASELAKGYEKLAALPHEASDAARFEAYAFKAAEIEPSKPRLAKLFTMVKAATGNKGQAEIAGRMLVRLRDLDTVGAAEGKYDALEQDLAGGDVALIKGKHAMVGWLALPSGWTKKGPWKVLVTVDGAGSGFLGSARGFRGGRGSRPFLVLAPCSFSNTNELTPEKYSFYDPELLKTWNGRRVEFDVAGLLSLLEVLRTRYGAEEKVSITGFSGGGNLCYSMCMQHPEQVWASAPACANFQPGLANGAKEVTDGGPPIHILTGANDEHKDAVFGQKPGIEGQSDWAEECFTKLKFTHVKRTMLPATGHSSCVKEVWAFFDEVLTAK